MANSGAMNVFAGTMAVLMILYVAANAYSYHTMAKADYKTPYYVHSWIENPYLMLRLSMLPSTHEVKMNAVRNEVWHVKTTMVGDVRYWTLLSRLPIGEDFFDNSHVRAGYPCATKRDGSPVEAPPAGLVCVSGRMEPATPA